MMVRINNSIATPTTLSGDVANAIVSCTYWPTTGQGEEVTETIPVILEGSEATIKSAVQAITNLFQEAAMAEGAINYPVYLEFQATASASVYRSQLKSGYVQWDQETIRHRLDSASNTVEVDVVLTRLNFWEGPETEIFLSTQAQAEAIGGRFIYNNNNATSSNNYFQIASNRITGDLPAPIKLRIANRSGASLDWRRFYVCNNVFSTPASADVWLLGSEAVGGATQSWGAGGITHSSYLYVFNLSSTLITQARGRFFRAVAVFTSATANMYFKAGLYASNSGLYYPLRTGRERWNSFDGSGITAFRLLDLGQFPVPPGGYSTVAGGVALIITARCTGSGATTMNFVQLMAAESVDEFNGFMHFEQVGYTVLDAEYVDINGIDGGAAYYSAGSAVFGSIKMHTEPLYVWPGKTQRIHVLFDEGAAFVAGRQMSVIAWYRPRVRTIG